MISFVCLSLTLLTFLLSFFSSSYLISTRLFSPRVNLMPSKLRPFLPSGGGLFLPLGHGDTLNPTTHPTHPQYIPAGAMLVRPPPMCPRLKILGCCIPWTKCPLAIVPLTEPCVVRSMGCAVHAWRGPGLGHIGQGHNIQGTLCSRGATSKNFWSGTHRSGTHQPWTPYILYIYSQKWKVTSN